MKSYQSRLTREEWAKEFRACLAFSIFAIATLYGLLSIG